jgi:hypothetical protein
VCHTSYLVVEQLQYQAARRAPAYRHVEETARTSPPDGCGGRRHRAVLVAVVEQHMARAIATVD